MRKKVVIVGAGVGGLASAIRLTVSGFEVEIFENALSNYSKAEKLNHILCGMEMAQRSVHPMGVKYLISQRGVPIKPLTRYPRKISLEEKNGLEAASRYWFSEDGSLKKLNKS